MGKIDRDILMNIDQIKDVFVLAMGQHQKGDLVRAEQAYRQILDTVPSHAGSIHNLDLILFQRGNIETAIAMYRRALEIVPNYDEAYNNLGVALESQGYLSDAHTAYQQAVRLLCYFLMHTSFTVGVIRWTSVYPIISRISVVGMIMLMIYRILALIIANMSA
jgi:Tfp pilus assembly protein PilF